MKYGSLSSITRPHSLLALMACLSAFQSTFATAQESVIQTPAAKKIGVDAEILAAFVDEPCHHFEAGKRAFLRGDKKQAADHLRTASAFLQLQAARATPHAKRPLVASIRELQQLASLIEQNRLNSTLELHKICWNFTSDALFSSCFLHF